MGTRVELHGLLKTITPNVYYASPSPKNMNYPAIRYSKIRKDDSAADDTKYITRRAYQLIVIAELPDSPILDTIDVLPYSKWEREYTADGLQHDVYTLYY